MCTNIRSDRHEKKICYWRLASAFSCWLRTEPQRPRRCSMWIWAARTTMAVMPMTHTNQQVLDNIQGPNDILKKDIGYTKTGLATGYYVYDTRLAIIPIN